MVAVTPPIPATAIQKKPGVRTKQVKGPIGRFFQRVADSGRTIGKQIKSDAKSHKYGSVITDVLDAPYVTTRNAIVHPTLMKAKQFGKSVEHGSEELVHKTVGVAKTVASGATHAVGSLVRSIEPELLIGGALIIVVLVVASKATDKFI